MMSESEPFTTYAADFGGCCLGLSEAECADTPVSQCWAREGLAKRMAQPPMQRAMESIKDQVVTELRRRWHASVNEMVKAELSALDDWVGDLVTTVIEPNGYSNDHV